jgi:hypothetical protein
VASTTPHRDAGDPAEPDTHPIRIDGHEHRDSTRRPTRGWVVAAVAAAVAVGVGIWASQVSGDLDDARLALEREQEAAARLADPAARTVALEAGQGRLVVLPDGRAVLVLDDLDAAPAGKTYEAWIVERGSPVPAGIFPGAETRDLVPLEGTVDPGDVVAVTVEDGLVAAPEGEIIVASQPA